MRTTPLGRESRDAVEKLSRAETSDTFDSDILGQFPSEVEDSRPVVSVEVQRRQAEVDRIRDDNGLRKRVCTWSLVIVSAQLLVCNVGIIVYGVATVVSGGTIPAEVILGWMGSCLVEVIGVLTEIVKSLFPKTGTRR